MNRWRRFPALVLSTSAVLSPAAGCAAPDVPARGRLTTSAWARPADSGATSGAYLTVVNDDTVAAALVGVGTPIAAAAEVHESIHHEGVAHMEARATVPIAPRDSLVMRPGGVHVMLLQLVRALAPGDTVPLTLRFAAGDSLVVRVPVRAP